MEACIIACGRSSRLYPFTLDRPKALVPLGEQTVLTHQLNVLHGWGINRITVLHRDDHDPALVTRCLPPAHRTVRVEPAPPHWPGVYAWLREHYTGIRTTVVTLNCDLILDPTWNRVLADHLSTNATLTLAATPQPGPHEGQYGRPRLLTITADGFATATRPAEEASPPGHGEVVAHQIGVSIVAPAAWPHLAGLSHHAEDPWADEFVPALVRSGHHVRVAVHAAPWQDVGTWYRLWLAHRDLATATPTHQHIHPTARIAPTARIEGWAYLGSGTRLGDHTVVTNSAVLTGAELADASSLTDGLALPGAHLASKAHHHGTVHLPSAAPQPMPQAPRT